VFRSVKMPAVCVFAVFLVTLTLFPSIMLLIKSTSANASWHDEWFDIVMMSTFMVGDWLGRSTPSFYMLIPANYLWILVAVRLGFFPLFAWCVLEPYADWLPIVIVLLLAYTNGLSGTLGMIYAPQTVRAHERETAGLVMTFFLNFGIFCGVQLALPVRYVLVGNWGIQ